MENPIRRMPFLSIGHQYSFFVVYKFWKVSRETQNSVQLGKLKKLKKKQVPTIFFSFELPPKKLELTRAALKKK
jgi:hypothetical protein